MGHPYLLKQHKMAIALTRKTRHSPQLKTD